MRFQYPRRLDPFSPIKMGLTAEVALIKVIGHIYKCGIKLTYDDRNRRVLDATSWHETGWGDRPPRVIAVSRCAHGTFLKGVYVIRHKSLPRQQLSAKSGFLSFLPLESLMVNVRLL